MLRQQSTLFHRLHQYSVFFGACCIAVRFEPIIPSHSIFFSSDTDAAVK